jgi:3-isopropylmalate dehydrogenase
LEESSEAHDPDNRAGAVMSRRHYTVACLAGDGVGPELMAEASQVLAAVSRLHHFTLEEQHATVAAEALTRSGHALPPATRRAALGADAVLVACPRDPAIAFVKAELDLGATVRRAWFDDGGDAALVYPRSTDDADWTITRSVALALSRGAKLASVSTDERWRARVDMAAAAHAGLLVEHLSLAAAQILLREEPRHFDVILAERGAADAMADGAVGVLVAGTARLARRGPSMFSPTHRSTLPIAGQGVANPAGMLLATAMLLSDGLGEHAAARTLEGAVAQTLRQGVRTADMVSAGVAATTREFTEVVLSELPRAREDTEFITREALA